jgi:hypothetical protein
MKLLDLKTSLQLKEIGVKMKSIEGFCRRDEKDEWFPCCGDHDKNPHFFNGKNSCARYSYDQIINYFRDKRKIGIFIDEFTTRKLYRYKIVFPDNIQYSGKFTSYYKCQLSAIKCVIKRRKSIKQESEILVTCDKCYREYDFRNHHKCY